MTYFAQDGTMHGYHRRGEYIPPAPITRVYCDACAKSGLVPFEISETGLRHQCRPWKWAPWFGGGRGCDCCLRAC